MLSGSHSVTVATTAINDLADNRFAGITSKNTLSFDTADTTPPLLLSTTPNGSSPVKLTQNVVLEFNETVKAGVGNVIISNEKDIHKIAITDKFQVTFNSKTVTINLTDTLLPSRVYSVAIDANAINDLAGNLYVNSADTPLRFTTVDTLAPQLDAITATAATMDVKKNIVLTFNEAIKAGSSNLVISNGIDTHTISITDKSQIKISNKTVTINPKTDLNFDSTYSLKLAAGTLKDLKNNVYSGNEDHALVFQTVAKTSVVDNTPTTPVVTPPVIATPTIPVVTPPVITTPTTPGVTTPAITTPTTPVVETPPAITIPTTPIVVDTVAPTLSSFTPLDNSLNVSKSANLVLTFSEAIQVYAGFKGKSSGTITLTGDNDVRVIQVKDSSQVTISDKTLTINPTNDLSMNKAYSVKISDGAIRDLAGNSFAGINDSTTFNFNTETGAAIRGTAIDGYLSKAIVKMTVAGKTVSVDTNSQGDYIFPKGTPSGTLVVSGGKDLATTKGVDGVLKAPAGSSVITPLTTMQQGFIEKAQATVAKAFGFDGSKLNLMTYDPIGEALALNKTGTAAQKAVAASVMGANSKLAVLPTTATKTLANVATKPAAPTSGFVKTASEDDTENYLDAFVGSLAGDISAKLDSPNPPDANGVDFNSDFISGALAGVKDEDSTLSFNSAELKAAGNAFGTLANDMLDNIDAKEAAALASGWLLIWGK